MPQRNSSRRLSPPGACVRFVALGSLLAVGGLRAPAANADKDQTAAAREMLERAYSSRHYYGESFPGFEAKVTCVFGNEKTAGRVKVDSSGKTELDLPGAVPRQWVEEQLSIILSHRLRRPMGRYESLRIEEDDGHPFGRRIRADDPFETAFRIRDNRVREIQRNAPGFRFVVSILDYTRAADGKELPRHLAVSYFDRPSGRLLRTFVFQDSYRQVGKYALPERRLAIGSSEQGIHTVYFELTDHKLLPKTTDL